MLQKPIMLTGYATFCLLCLHLCSVLLARFCLNFLFMLTYVRNIMLVFGADASPQFNKLGFSGSSYV